MKKHLIAAAVAAAVAAPAMAQNVSLYGALDAGVYQISNGNSTGKDIAAFADGSIVSSVWGFRGVEDLGGGLKATFDLQGDAMTNNGNTHSAGLFRRQANVGLGGSFGQFDFGLKTNPIIATNSAVMPVSGNTVSTNFATGMGFADFFTKNAITYTSPSLSGLTAQVQYGFANTIQSDSDAGRMYAGSLAYVNGPVTVRYAMQEREAGTASSSQSNASTSGKKTSLLGASVKLDALTLGAAFVQNKIDSANFTPSGGAHTLIVGQKYSATQIGAGYQLSPAVLLGATYTSAESTKMYNLQARYSLSKRTTAYAQYTNADNDGKIAFGPVATNSGTPANIGGPYVPTLNTRQSAFGVGLIHSF